MSCLLSLSRTFGLWKMSSGHVQGIIRHYEFQDEWLKVIVPMYDVCALLWLGRAHVEDFWNLFEISFCFLR